MKNVISLGVLLALCLSLCACNSEIPQNPSGKPAQATEAETVEQELRKNADGLYELYNVQHLVEYRDILEEEMRASYENNGRSTHATSGAILMADIDMSTVCSEELGNWRPIGFKAIEKKSGDLSSGSLYQSLFDGNGHTISGLYIDCENVGGLFVCLWETEVRDLTFANVNIRADSGSAAVLAYSMLDGKLSGICLDKTVSVHMEGAGDAYYTIGGIVAFAKEHNSSVTIEDCENHGTVTTAASGRCDIGGIVGSTNRNVDFIRCKNYGEVSSSGTENAIVGVKLGGIVGHADGESYYDGTLIGCVNYGIARANDGYIGGIVGHSQSTVKCCVNMGTVEGGAVSNGIGVNDGLMFNCLNAGSANSIAEKVGINVSAGDPGLTDGSLVTKLNGLAKGAYWKQGDSHPEWSGLE